MVRTPKPLPPGAAVALLLLGAGCQRPAAPPPTPAPTATPVAVQPLSGNGDLPADVAETVQTGLEAVQQQDLRTLRGVIQTLAPRANASADLAERLATLSRAAGQVDLSWKFARMAVSIAPDSPSALLVLTVTESDLDWVAAVPSRLKRIKELAPSSVEPRLALATNLQAANQHKAAEAEYRELIALEPDNPAGWGMLAGSLHLQARYDEARQALQEASRIGGSDNPAVWILAARIDLDEADARPDLAPTLRKRALETLETHCNTQPVPAGLFVLGVAREATGDLKGARTALESAYAQMPNYPRIRTRLGRLRARLGETAGAEKLFVEEQKATDQLDELRRVVNRSGAALADPERHRAVALVADRRKMVSRARLEWQLVARLKPGDPQAKARLAVLMPGVPNVPLPKDFP